MSYAVRLLLAAAALVMLAAAPASAATPFTAGTGTDPAIAVGSDGTGHAVWAAKTGDNSQVGYCRMTAGSAACNRAELLDFGASTAAQSTGQPMVFTPAPGKVVIVAGCWQCPTGITDRTYRWISTDNGASFGPAAQIGSGIETNGMGAWLDTPGLWVGASGARAKAAKSDDLDGVEYAPGTLFVYSPSVVRVPGTDKLVAATNDLDTVKYGVYTGSGTTTDSINNVVNWQINKTLAAPEADDSETHLTDGPNGVFLSYLWFVPNDNHLGLRRFDAATNTFGAPVYIEGGDPIDDYSLDYPYTFQDPAGRIHAVWRTLYDGQRLRYRVSNTAGTSFTAAANLATKETFNNLRVAAAGDAEGFAIWTNGTSGNVRVVALDPQPEPATPGSGGGTPPPPTTGPAVKPVFSFKGRGNTLTALIVGRRIKVRIKGSIGLPSDADPTTACTGKVRLKLKKRKRVMLNRTARVHFKKGRCRFKKTAYLKRRKVGKTRRLALKVRFMGNTVLKAGSKKFTLIVRK
jgi:hypothetical protein